MIKINDLSLKIKEHLILDNVNISMENGRIYGLVGSNGSGKTMLMKCICGFITPTGGNVVVDDKVIGKDVDYIKGAGIILETPGFIPYYTGMKNLKVLYAINKKPDKKKIAETMKMCGLDKEGVEVIRQLLLGFKKDNKLIILSSHNRADIDILCDEVYEVDKGQVKKEA